jgi:hypothetical protein
MKDYTISDILEMILLNYFISNYKYVRKEMRLYFLIEGSVRKIWYSKTQQNRMTNITLSRISNAEFGKYV